MAAQVEIVEADLQRTDHQLAVVALTAAYALDPMGNSGPLSDEVLARLVAGLRSHPTTLVFLAYRHGRPVAIATCFRGFSTFFALPLINIHDLAVLPEFRGQGIGRQLLVRVEQKARETGCCKVTLEVQDENLRAKQVYAQCGYGQAVYGVTAGGALFYTKLL